MQRWKSDSLYTLLPFSASWCCWAAMTNCYAQSYISRTATISKANHKRHIMTLSFSKAGTHTTVACKPERSFKALIKFVWNASHSQWGQTSKAEQTGLVVAVGTISHDIFLGTLSILEVSSSVLHWFCDFLSGRTQKVVPGTIAPPLGLRGSSGVSAI